MPVINLIKRFWNSRALIWGGGLVMIGVMVLGVLWWQGKVGSVLVWSDKDLYKDSEPLRLKVWNLSSSQVCFSSCYPFHFWEKRGEKWQSLQFSECPFEDKAIKCVAPFRMRAFEVEATQYFNTGEYAVGVRLCESCREGDLFSSPGVFYGFSVVKVEK